MERVRKEEGVDATSAIGAAERVFLDAKDRVVGVSKIVAGGTLMLAGLGVTIVGFPGGIIAAGIGGVLVNRGVEQAVFRPMDRRDDY